MMFHDRLVMLVAVVGNTAMVAALASPVMAASDEQCSDFLNRPGVYVSGRLSTAYRDALRQSGRAILSDGTVDRMTILNGCAASAFDLTSNAPGGNAAFQGPTRYTKSEARAHMEKAGFKSISNLRLDTTGTWRANAMQPSKPVSVALDYNGNVTGE